MKAMLFAAGLGTRLRPLTDDKPKALVEVAGKTLLEWNLLNLAQHGVTEAIVNVHAFADLMEEFIGRLNIPGLKITISDERDELLETGGGLLKAQSLLGDQSFLVHNVDIISKVDLSDLVKQHFLNESMVTLCVTNRKTSRYLIFTRETNELVGWKNTKTGEERPARRYLPHEVYTRAFSGIAIYDPGIFDYMAGQEGEHFSIIDTLLKAAVHEPIIAYSHSKRDWVDVGRPASIEPAEWLIR